MTQEKEFEMLKEMITNACEEYSKMVHEFKLNDLKNNTKKWFFIQRLLDVQNASTLFRMFINEYTATPK